VFLPFFFSWQANLDPTHDGLYELLTSLGLVILIDGDVRYGPCVTPTTDLHGQQLDFAALLLHLPICLALTSHLCLSNQWGFGIYLLQKPHVTTCFVYE
jgi:hypothetical protein